MAYRSAFVFLEHLRVTCSVKIPKGNVQLSESFDSCDKRHNHIDCKLMVIFVFFILTTDFPCVRYEFAPSFWIFWILSCFFVPIPAFRTDLLRIVHNGLHIFLIKRLIIRRNVIIPIIYVPSILVSELLGRRINPL